VELLNPQASRTRRVRLASLIGIAALVALAVGASAETEGPSEEEVKAAFLYNFARFVSWPQDLLSGREAFSVCVLGDAGFESAVERVLADKQLGGLPIAVRAPSDLRGAPACQVLYVSADVDAGDRLARAAEGPVLIVGDVPGFARDAGMIGFVRSGRKLRFEVHRGRAERAGLAVSSHLLKLAQDVYE
jgi:hypothetical protein